MRLVQIGFVWQYQVALIGPERTTSMTAPKYSLIEVARTDGGSYKISWDETIIRGAASIFAGPAPESIDQSRPVGEISTGDSADVSGLDQGKRYYFAVVDRGGRVLVGAERKLPVDGTHNFRDLGGYLTADGRTVRWGLVFRSDALSRLSPAGTGLLGALGIRLVCDFRTLDEAGTWPDKLPADGPEYLHLPVGHDGFNYTTALEKIKKGDVSWFTDDFMVKGYIKNITGFASVWGRMIECLARAENRPLLFHCTGGKDRAGTAAAIILLALGVPEETVVHDHGLSTRYIEPMLTHVAGRLRDSGVDPELIRPYFSAPREGIEAVIDQINNNFGGIENYLITRGGVTTGTLAGLKQALLEDVRGSGGGEE